MYEYQVTDIYEAAAAVAEDKDGVLAVEGVEEEHETSHDTHVPEVDGYDTLTHLLRGNPLHKETAHEGELPYQTQHQPKIRPEVHYPGPDGARNFHSPG